MSSNSSFRERKERILLGQGDGHTASLTTGHDGDLMHWVVGGQGVHGDGVTGFMVSGETFGHGG